MQKPKYFSWEPGLVYAVIKKSDFSELESRKPDRVRLKPLNESDEVYQKILDITDEDFDEIRTSLASGEDLMVCLRGKPLRNITKAITLVDA